MKKIYLFLVFLILLCQLEARLYFIHIPKTAGTSMRLLLESQVCADEVCPYRNPMQVNGPITQEVVSGHLPYWLCRQLDSRFEEAFKVTILRDPVQRYLSFLRAKKKRNQDFPDLEAVMKERFSQNERVRNSLIDNALCRNLASDPRLEGQALLESAKETLQTLDCILFFESFTQDAIDLFKRFGIELNEKEIPNINVTQKEPVSELLLQEIKQLNELDIQLYEFAKTLPRKNTQYPLRSPDFEQIVKKGSFIDYTFDLPLNGRGWTYREAVEGKGERYPIYRWVMDQPAYIYFSLEEGSEYDFYFTAHCLKDEVFPQAFMNGKEIALTKLSHTSFAKYYGKIPKEWVSQEPAEFCFCSLKTFEYRDVHPKRMNRNYPPLAFAVNRIVIAKKGH